jgi:putative transposase
MENQTRLSESYKNKYEHYAHGVGTLMFHLQWCTKYRYKMFRKQENAKLLEACVRRAASKHGIKIIEINVQPEHVHCIVSFGFSFSVSKVLQILRGGSAKIFFEYKEKARLRYPKGHLWSRGKFASSVGFVQLDVVQNYVRCQDEHH